MKYPLFLFKDRTPFFSFMVAIFLSLSLGAYLFPPYFLQGHGSFFEQGNSDSSQSVSGWLIYRDDQWRFPLAYTQNLSYPEGASITLTDSIPLAAVIFKIFRHWLPPEFHYFGWWHLLAYLLQGISAVILIRALGYRSLLASLAAAGFALLMPAFTFRYPHTSLTTHALILFSFCVYVLGANQQWSLSRCTWVFMILSVAALLIHPYFLGMVYPIYLAYLIDFSYKNRKIKPCLKSLSLSLIVILSSLFLFGYYGGDVKGDDGFGYYSMNFLSPICGGFYGFEHCNNGTRGQYEGLNYLGLGLILLIILALVTQRKLFQKLLKQFPAFSILLILFWLFALSNTIYFGKHLLFHLPLPRPILDLSSIYRSSGRFFWPVSYVLLFVGLTGALSLPKKMITIVILMAALCLQWFDTQKLIDNQRNALKQPVTNHIQDWNLLLKSSTAIDIFPIFYQYKGNHLRYVFFQLLAGENHIPINAAYLAHRKVDATEKRRFFENPLIKDHLYIIMPEVSVAAVPSTIRELMRNNECRQFVMTDQSKGIACRISSSPEWWQENAPWMQAVPNN